VIFRSTWCHRRWCVSRGLCLCGDAASSCRSARPRARTGCGVRNGTPRLRIDYSGWETRASGNRLCAVDRDSRPM